MNWRRARRLLKTGGGDSTQAGPPDLVAQRAYYEKRWAHPEYANLLQLERATAVLSGLRTVNLRSPRILDLGCGTGWLTTILGRFGPTTGVDLSPVAIHRAQGLFPDVTFMAGDLFGLPFPDEAFDVVVAVQVLDHVENQRRFLDLAVRLLTRGGHLILITTNAKNMARWTRSELEQFAGGLQPVEEWVTPRELRSLLEPQFKLKQLRTILPGFGNRGILRIAHSQKLANFLKALRVFPLYQEMLLRAGFGLVIFAVAERR